MERHRGFDDVQWKGKNADVSRNISMKKASNMIEEITRNDWENEKRLRKIAASQK